MVAERHACFCQSISDLCQRSAHSVPRYLISYLPGHHTTDPGGPAPADQETHRGVCDGIPGPAHKQDDGCIEGIQLVGKGV